MKQTMDCKVFNKLMPFFHDGDLGAGQLKAFENHAGECESCRNRYERFSQIYQLAGADTITQTNPFLYHRIMAIITQKREQQGVMQIIRLRPAVLAAAVFIPLMLGILLGYSFSDHEKTKLNNHELIADMNTMLTYASAHNADYLLLYDPE